MSEELKPESMDDGQRNAVSWMAYLIGGFNATGGVHAGRFMGHDEYKAGIEASVRFLLSEHGHDCQRDLKKEIGQLKSKLYDQANARPVEQQQSARIAELEAVIAEAIQWFDEWEEANTDKHSKYASQPLRKAISDTAGGAA